MMKRNSYFILGIMMLSLWCVAFAGGCSNRSSSAPSTPPMPVSPTQPMPSNQMMSSPSGTSTTADLVRLGVKGDPSLANPRGLRITEFIPSSTPSPLQVIGVQKGDVITSCNGKPGQLGFRINQAIDGLQERGEAITLVVVRGEKSITLTRTEKLPTTSMKK